MVDQGGSQVEGSLKKGRRLLEGQQLEKMMQIRKCL
jgi:hypothetical protein